jgi:hypothetical protein
MVAGERPTRCAICAIERPSASRKWRARTTARRRSATRSVRGVDALAVIPGHATSINWGFVEVGTQLQTHLLDLLPASVVRWSLRQEERPHVKAGPKGRSLAWRSTCPPDSPTAARSSPERSRAAEKRLGHQRLLWGLFMHSALPYGWVGKKNCGAAAAIWIPPNEPELTDEDEASWSRCCASWSVPEQTMCCCCLNGSRRTIRERHPISTSACSELTSTADTARAWGYSPRTLPRSITSGCRPTSSRARHGRELRVLNSRRLGRQHARRPAGRDHRRLGRDAVVSL